LNNANIRITDKWIKASIIGTIWAASEIVLGSFLHNLKVPFSGNILTGIGLTILISVSYIWNEKGLFWRAGVICALMKTLSPSAFIFGPMIAIFAESALLEASVRIFGRTIPGYLVGSMLAMSWNLFQKAVNLIIFYGNNFIELYTNLVRYAEKQLNTHFDIFWMPLIILLVLYCAFGALSGMVGIRAGRRTLRQPAMEKSFSQKDSRMPKNKSRQDFRYSLVWLAFDIVIMVSLLLLVSSTRWYIWTVSVTVAVVIWSLRYDRAVRQLSKPRFWVFFVLITMISALVFTSVQPGEKDYMGGFMIGIEMNFRAIIIIVGFTVLGTELYNPKIRELFLKTYFRQLPLALEMSTASLPLMISSIPDFKSLVRDPVTVLSRLIAGVEERLSEIKGDNRENRMVIILSGEIAGGKTTCIMNVIKSLKDAGIKVRGVFAPRIVENGLTVGYDIVDILEGTRERFMRIDGIEGDDTVGRFSIFGPGLKLGLDALETMKISPEEVLIIDEVGPMELQGRGWAERISEIMNSNIHCVIMVVRRGLEEKVKEKWNITGSLSVELSADVSADITGLVMTCLKRKV